MVHIVILTYRTALNQLTYNIECKVANIFQNNMKSYLKQENYREVKF